MKFIIIFSTILVSDAHPKYIGNYEIYSDKLGVRVLNLKSVDDTSVLKEPEELYQWAKLFKASTWEEIKMLAEKNEYIADTIVTLKQLSADEKIRMQCQAREDYEHDRATLLRQGREEGNTLPLIKQICKKLIKSKTLDEIADDLEEEVENIRAIYDVAVRFAPNYDSNKVYEAYRDEKASSVHV